MGYAVDGGTIGADWHEAHCPPKIFVTNPKKTKPMQIKSISRIAVAGLIAAQAVPAMAAGGTITYSVASSIPTLSEWGLIIMAAIMAVVAYRELRKSKRGQPLASLAALGILGLAAFVNNGSSWDARADLVLGTVSISDANATQVVMSEDNIYEVTNTSGVTVQITGVTPSIDSSVGDIPGQVQYNAYRPICTVGSSLAAGAKCYVWWINNNA
jgi:hypothetical protein